MVPQELVALRELGANPATEVTRQARGCLVSYHRDPAAAEVSEHPPTPLHLVFRVVSHARDPHNDRKCFIPVCCRSTRARLCARRIVALITAISRATSTMLGPYSPDRFAGAISGRSQVLPVRVGEHDRERTAYDSETADGAAGGSGPAPPTSATAPPAARMRTASGPERGITGPAGFPGWHRNRGSAPTTNRRAAATSRGSTACSSAATSPARRRGASRSVSPLRRAIPPLICQEAPRPPRSRRRPGTSHRTRPPLSRGASGGRPPEWRMPCRPSCAEAGGCGHTVCTPRGGDRSKLFPTGGRI